MVCGRSRSACMIAVAALWNWMVSCRLGQVVLEAACTVEELSEPAEAAQAGVEGVDATLAASEMFETWTNQLGPQNMRTLLTDYTIDSFSKK